MKIDMFWLPRPTASDLLLRFLPDFFFHLSAEVVVVSCLSFFDRICKTEPFALQTPKKVGVLFLFAKWRIRRVETVIKPCF